MARLYMNSNRERKKKRKKKKTPNHVCQWHYPVSPSKRRSNYSESKLLQMSNYGQWHMRASKCIEISACGKYRLLLLMPASNRTRPTEHIALPGAIYSTWSRPSRVQAQAASSPSRPRVVIKQRPVLHIRARVMQQALMTSPGPQTVQEPKRSHSWLSCRLPGQRRNIRDSMFS